MIRLRIIIIIFFIITNVVFSGNVRIKDISSIENLPQESLVGYGLVVGLDGTGDRSGGNRGAIFTVQSIANMLERFGITLPKEKLRTRNVAAVMVTAKSPAFGRIGTQFDVVVSSLGDATSLEGGVLLMTPLFNGKGVQYGYAQGPVSIGGYNIETEAGEKFRKNHALVGRVPNGATLEKFSPNKGFDLNQPIRIILNEPDLVTSTRIAESINNFYGIPLDEESMEEKIAHPINAGVVEVPLPDWVENQDDVILFMASIETLMVQPDIEARVVINERTGTIVAGGNVRIDEVMISHGALTIHVKRRPIISQPVAPFSSTGRTVVEYVTETTIQEGEAQTAVIPSTTTVSDLASALNELGLRPRDIIAIFQALKQAGALNARLIIM